jgi:hypothetical protein
MNQDIGESKVQHELEEELRDNSEFILRFDSPGLVPQPSPKHSKPIESLVGTDTEDNAKTIVELGSTKSLNPRFLGEPAYRLYIRLGDIPNPDSEKIDIERYYSFKDDLDLVKSRVLTRLSQEVNLKSMESFGNVFIFSFRPEVVYLVKSALDRIEETYRN